MTTHPKTSLEIANRALRVADEALDNVARLESRIDKLDLYLTQAGDRFPAKDMEPVSTGASEQNTPIPEWVNIAKLAQVAYDNAEQCMWNGERSLLKKHWFALVGAVVQELLAMAPPSELIHTTQDPK